MDRVIENVIEWLIGDNKAAVTFSQRKHITRLKRLKSKFPDAVEIVAENQDGSIFAHVPLDWVKISPPRQISEEQRKRLSENNPFRKSGIMKTSPILDENGLDGEL